MKKHLKNKLALKKVTLVNLQDSRINAAKGGTLINTGCSGYTDTIWIKTIKYCPILATDTCISELTCPKEC